MEVGDCPKWGKWAGRGLRCGSGRNVALYARQLLVKRSPLHSQDLGGLSLVAASLFENTEKAAQMETASARDYNLAAMECAANADAGSRQIFEDLVRDEERHYDHFDKQRDNIGRFGLSYLALQSFGEPPKTGAGSA